MFQQSDQIASIFYADGENLANSLIPDNFSIKDIFRAISRQYEAIDKLIDSFALRCKQSEVNIDCKKGCEFCCHQPVFANIQEILLVVDYINSNFSVAQIENIQTKALDKIKKIDATSVKELLKYSHACPLLVDGACSVYPVRPMACRIYMSSDVNSCIRRYELEEEDSEFPSLFEFLLIAGRNMNRGFSERLNNLNLQVTENRLEVILYLILSDIENQEKWLRGIEIIENVNIE